MPNPLVPRAVNALVLLLAVSTGGPAACARPLKPVPAPVAAPSVAVAAKADLWRRVASPADENRIDRVRAAWTEALSEAASHGFGGEVRKEGVLLDARAALARPAPSPGSFSCRLVRLGSSSKKNFALERFKPFYCYIQPEGEQLAFVKQTGSERPAGRLWEDDAATRMVYLGSLGIGEAAPRTYGEDRSHDMAGVMERIAPFKWRLVIPWPRGGSTLDVYELTPVADQPK